MTMIQINHLSFRYDEGFEDIFHDISFTIDSHFKTALIGRNARGKTTLLKLMMGEYDYQGTIVMKERCEYFPYHVSNKKDRTLHICQNIYPSLEVWKLERELNYLDVNLDVLYRSFDTLSQGEQTKVLLAILFLKENTFLLIDEPTNHLDQETRNRVSQYLKRQKGFLLVSHDRVFIDQCCDHIIAINPTTIDVVNGNFSSWFINKTNQDQENMQKNSHLKKDIQRLENARKQTESWSHKIENTKNGQRISGVKADKGHIGHQAAKMMKRSKNIQRRQKQAIQDKRSLLNDLEEYDDLKIQPLSYHQNILLDFKHFGLYNQEKTLFQDMTFSLERNDRILLKGKNGCGKSSLISFILNHNIDYRGEFYQAYQIKISYVPQDCSYLTGTLEDIIESYHVKQSLVKTILRKLGFTRIQFEKKLELYSKGQKKKVMLAISLATSAHLYIWDEPLNYIDVYSRIQIEKMVLKYKPTLLFVEHDQCFQEKIATKVIDFNDFF